MRFNPIKLLEGLLYTAPALFLTLAACGGGGGGGGGGSTTPVAPPTAAPTGVTLVAGCTAININWSAVTGATGYNVYGAASGVTAVKLTSTPITATSYTNTGLASNTTYYYQVTATNSGGEGPASAALYKTTPSPCATMGGSVQGNPLSLTDAVSTMEGTALYQGLVNGAGAGVQFSSPRGVTTDGTNLYVADTSNNVIRKIVISTGVVSTLAGSSTGQSGSTDSPALFDGPQGITTDGTFIYVADTNNGSIRKIDASGNVTTLGTANAFILPAAITYGGGTNLYIADTNNNSIKLVDSSTGTVSSTFTTTPVNSPQGITTDGTNLYITSGNSIQKVVMAGGTPVSLITDSGLNIPQGITTDGTNLYIANSADHTIRTILTAGGTLNTVAGTSTVPGSTDGTGSAALFRNPGGVTTDGTNLYITDTGNQTIRKIE